MALIEDSDVSGLDWGGEADPYAAAYVMIGLKASVGNEKVKGYINPVFGRCTFMAGDVKVTGSRGGGALTSITGEQTDPAPGLIYGGSVGADFRVSELININLDLLFLHSNIKDITRTYNYDDPSISDFDSYAQKYSTANFTVGIGFNF